MLRRWKSNEQICLLFGIVTCLVNFVQSDVNGDAIKNLLFKTSVTKEEESSPHIPEDYLCDACWAVVYSLEQGLEKTVKKPNKRDLSESDVVNVIDELCDNESYWERYGLKEIDGEKRFAGPGLETENMFGFVIDGNYWSERMRDFCWRLLGSKEEHEFFELFQKGELKNALCHQGKPSYCEEAKKSSDEL